MRITFGIALGGGLVAIGGMFAIIDSVILFKGWGAYGLDWADKLSYGLSAASIPYVVAVYPFVWWVMWLRGRWRAVLPLAIAGVVYTILIAYSLIGAMGSIATQRSQVIAEKHAAHDSLDALKSQRDRYRNELGWIVKHRPPDQVAAQIAAAQLSRQWEWTEGCKTIANGSQRKFCTELSALRGELAAAKQSETIHRKMDVITAQIDGRAVVGEKADPMAATLVLWLRKAGFQVTESEASMGLPITTPVILLIGEMFFVWLGFMLLGIDHKRLLEVPQREPAAATAGAVRLGRATSAPALPPPVPLATTLTRQRELCVWFFRTYTRPAPDGSLAESDWHRLYSEVCRRSNDEPLPLAAFRRIAGEYVPQIKDIDGVTYFRGVLPDMRKESAA